MRRCRSACRSSPRRGARTSCCASPHHLQAAGVAPLAGRRADCTTHEPSRSTCPTSLAEVTRGVRALRGRAGQQQRRGARRAVLARRRARCATAPAENLSASTRSAPFARRGRRGPGAHARARPSSRPSAATSPPPMTEFRRDGSDRDRPAEPDLGALRRGLARRRRARQPDRAMSAAAKSAQRARRRAAAGRAGKLAEQVYDDAQGADPRLPARRRRPLLRGRARRSASA